MSNYEKNPTIRINGEFECITGWEKILTAINENLSDCANDKKILVIECYHGVNLDEIIEGIKLHFPFDSLTIANTLMHNDQYIQKIEPNLSN